MLLVWLHALALAVPPCAFFDGDAAVTQLDCDRGGTWAVRCPLPTARSGKVRVRLRVPSLGLEAEAPLSLQAAGEGETTLAVGGPGNRAGLFVVSEPAAGLLPGQAVGPLQLCPVVQPDQAPGSPRARVPLEVEVSLHAHGGFTEEVGPSGVKNRVPVWGPGTSFAEGTLEVVQREVRTLPVLTGPEALPSDDEITGQLQVAAPDGTWHGVGYVGRRSDIGGPAVATRFDFVAAELAALGDPVTVLQDDLSRWLAGEETLLGLPAWARSDVPRQAVTFATVPQGGVAWRLARTADQSVEVRVGRFGDRVRVVIAWGALGAPGDLLELSTASLD